MSKRLSQTGIFLIFALLFTALTPLSARAAGSEIWVQNGSDRVFSSSARPAGAPGAITLYAARGENQAAQIAVRSGTAASTVVAPEELVGPGGARIPLPAITVSREYDHPNVETGYQGTEKAPDNGNRYYDALVENVPYTVPANETQPYYYSVTVPAGQAPGTYTGNAVVWSGAARLTVPVTVVVYDVTMPPADKSSFKMDNWFSSVGWDYGWAQSGLPAQYGVTPFSDNWWRVIGNFAADHAKHRNNVIHTDFQALLIPDTTVDAAGTFHFGWATFDRFVQTFVDAGALQYIATPHLIGEHGLTRLQAVDGKVTNVTVPTRTTEASDYLALVFGALKTHLDGKCLDPGPGACAQGRRWSDVFYMSAVDEPNDPAAVENANWVYGLFLDKFGNGLTNEAQWSHQPGDHAKLTTLTPMLDGQNYDRHVGYYQEQRIAGKDLWFYQTGDPKDGHVNRMLSYPLSDARLLPWVAASAGADGYLHWGWNIWSQNNGPEYTPLDTFDGSASGSAMLVRPNRATYGVYDSLRSEAQLHGLQDYELLRQLSVGKPVLARALVNSLVANSSTHTRSGADLEQRHKQILDALVAPAGDARFPFKDDFSAGVESDWSQATGSWARTADGAYEQRGLGWDVVSAVAGRAYGDAAASVDLTITGVKTEEGGDSNWAGLTLRSQTPLDLDSGYLVGVRNDGRVFLNRSGSLLKEAVLPGYTPGGPVNLRVVARGSSLRVYAGSTAQPLIEVTDTGYAAGAIGLATGGATARFDNVRINPGVNPVEDAAVTVSSSYQADGWHARAAVDGRRGSDAVSKGWSSASGPADRTEWITTDLGSVRPLSRIDLFPRSDGANTGLGFPVDFTVQVSADGAAWTTVASRTGYPRPGAGAQSFPFASVDARYVKVTGTKLGADQFGDRYLQLAEIEAGGGNLALGRPVTASSSVENTAAGWVRAAATDGVVNSGLGHSMGWSSQAAPAATGPEWVTVDLQGPSLIRRVDLTARTDGANTGLGFPVDFTVQVSSDDVHWTTVVDRTGRSRPGAAPQGFDFTPWWPGT